MSRVAIVFCKSLWNHKTNKVNRPAIVHCNDAADGQFELDKFVEDFVALISDLFRPCILTLSR